MACEPMKHQCHNSYWRFLVLVSALVLCGSGWGDYIIPLTARYKLSRLTGVGCMIVYSNSIVLGPTVVKMGNREGLFYGIINEDLAEQTNRFQYFVLDTDNDQMQILQKKEEWIRLLEESGVSNRCLLKRPTRFYSPNRTQEPTTVGSNYQFSATVPSKSD